MTDIIKTIENFFGFGDAESEEGTETQKAKATVINNWFLTPLFLNTDSIILNPINAKQNPYIKWSILSHHQKIS